MRSHPSRRAIFQIHWESIIQLNYPSSYTNTTDAVYSWGGVYNNKSGWHCDGIWTIVLISSWKVKWWNDGARKDWYFYILQGVKKDWYFCILQGREKIDIFVSYSGWEKIDNFVSYRGARINWYFVSYRRREKIDIFVSYRGQIVMDS